MTVLIMFLVALALARVTADIGRECGLVDVPDGRKRHTGRVPLTGGIAIWMLVLISPLLFQTAPLPLAVSTIACAVFFSGIVDDIHQTPPALRLILHYGAGTLLATAGGVAIHNVGNLLGSGDIALLFMTVPLTALAVAGLCNAYNMIDGIDGLAAATAALPLAVLYLLALEAGSPGATTILCWLIALAAFLLFNLSRQPALLPRVFLGDNGSLLLGFMVTVFLVMHSQGEQALIQPVTSRWLVAVPLMDMLSTMMLRYLSDRPVMQGDRSHLHHRLMDMGLSPRQTLVLLCLWGVLCALTGLALENIPAYLSLALYFLVFIGHCLFVLRSGRIAAYLARLGSNRVVADNLGK